MFILIKICCCYSVAKSCPTLATHGLLLIWTHRQDSQSPSLSPRVSTNLHPSIFPSIRVFSNELALPIRWRKNWSFSFKYQSFQWISRVDFLYDWLVWSPCSPRDSQESSPAPEFKSINFSALSLLYGPTLTSMHDYWTKAISLILWIFFGKVMSLLFNTLSRFIITFLPRSRHLLISWLQLPSQENKICHYFHFLPLYPFLFHAHQDTL